MRRLDIGIVSYGSPDKLAQTLAALRKNCTTDWRCWIVHNPHPAPTTNAEVLAVIASATKAEPGRFRLYQNSANCGYAAAVNQILELAGTEYVAYLDNDAYPNTGGWDEKLCKCLDQYHEVGIMFPNGGAYPIKRPGYTEVMWCPGFCWVLRRLTVTKAGLFDETLGHQEEADYCLRVRMAGLKCAALPGVSVKHDATATNDPASVDRIQQGVVAFVNKWVKYFCGAQVNYHSTNVMRWEDWPPNALYLEEYWLERLPGLNKTPQVIENEGRQYDLLRVPRFAGYYTGRII